MLRAISKQEFMSLLVWNWFHFSFEFQFTILHSCKSSNSSQLFKLGPKIIVYKPTVMKYFDFVPFLQDESNQFLHRLFAQYYQQYIKSGNVYMEQLQTNKK